jgi:hypothetical protein
MNYGAIAAFGVTAILIAIMLLISTHPVFAGSYEKSQSISQINECGNYWFPINVICSSLNSQVQGDENNVVMITTPDSDTNYGAPFP